MRLSSLQLSAMALLVTVFAGCGGGGGDSSAPPAPPPGGGTSTVQQAIAAAAAVSTNDSATNSAAPFTVLQTAGVPAVTVASPPKVNFTVFSDGAVKTGLAITNVSVVIAKLVPGQRRQPGRVADLQPPPRAAATASPTGVYSDAVRATLTTPAMASAIQSYHRSEVAVTRRPARLQPRRLLHLHLHDRHQGPDARPTA